MAAINDLISQIDNKELRDRILLELEKMNKQKKFGLVFEEHLPESVKLYDVPVKKGAFVMEKAGGKSVYKVLSLMVSPNVLILPLMKQSHFHSPELYLWLFSAPPSILI